MDGERDGGRKEVSKADTCGRVGTERSAFCPAPAYRSEVLARRDHHDDHGGSQDRQTKREEIFYQDRVSRGAAEAFPYYVAVA